MELSALGNREVTAWVDFEDTSTELRHVSLEEIEKLKKAATKRTFQKRTGLAIDVMDNVKFMQLLGNAAIVAWKGMEMHGEEYQCTPEHIDMLMSHWSDYAIWVNNNCTELALFVKKTEEAIQEEEEKNS